MCLGGVRALAVVCFQFFYFSTSFKSVHWSSGLLTLDRALVPRYSLLVSSCPSGEVMSVKLSLLLCWDVVSLHLLHLSISAMGSLFFWMFTVISIDTRFSVRLCVCMSSSSQLVIWCTWLSTIGDRVFPVAGSRLWNSRPPSVTSAPTLTVFSEPPQNLPFLPIIS